MNNNENKLVSEPEFKAGKDKEYKVKTIKDNVIYANDNKAESLLLGLYYLISLKNYSELEST